MMMNKIYYILFFCLALIVLPVESQELNAKLTINSSKIQSVDQEAIKEMEASLKTMLNEQSWSHTKVGKNERIDCTITITLNTMPAENTYGGEIYIVARRPVYNASYETTLLNYRDTKFDFTYMRGQTLDYNEISLNNNLVGVIAFYTNIILGLDFDSFAPNGGNPYFTKAMEIANLAQTLGTRGWEPFEGKSRYDLALALTEDNSKHFHNLWYNYHRLGLDEMTSNASRARIRILETLNDLETIQKARPNSLLLAIFSEAKLVELVNICEEATNEEKKNAKDRLKKLFPAKRTQIDEMK